MTQSYEYSRERVQAQEGAFIRRVYNWMVAGLALTGVMAYVTASSPGLQAIIYGNMMVFYGLILGELAMVFILAGRADRMKASTAGTMFIIYSLLNGLTLSFIFLIYTRSSITSAFFVTAGTFGAMSLYGYTTKKDLTSWGGFLMMGLVGIIIASVVNIFLGSEMILWLVTYAGVLIFVGLTAYDTQRLKRMALAGFSSEEVETKAAVLGALALYLDFINLFLMILRIFGGGRD
ncbi:MAG: Bax inhibitor-1/YccA family protein [Deltaproteobacteria bacterium]|nr:Bax inhibitor-1/YccA family protein [Deltaproteobacteria bacterium]MBW2052548.1 Bax inhibitor-1/YccA family protein [Deltaproteobacteria bacterium]MBW2139607.1 Bax inhibitor-1/YccA family protein [Deltaproteobacteria bacterium]MBW2323245.1 Bax inhibitor-1/YccA family protein [Deltaproteobacteria bacterium]